MLNSFTAVKLYKVTLIAEGLLLLLALLWAWIRNLPLAISPEAQHLLVGTLCAVGLFFLSMTLRSLSLRRSLFREFADFEKDILIPLSAGLNQAEIFIIALSSGIAEEIFFRGILDSELIKLLGPLPGISSSALIFALLHFGPAAFRYAPVLLVYFLFALGLSALSLLYNSLFPCIVVHAVYNFIALNFYASLTRQSSSESSPLK